MLTRTPSKRGAEPATVAIIGAGAAGLIAARNLSDGRLSVTLIDKSRGLGGRLATRRAEDFSFDHGCPSIRPADEADVELMRDMAAEGTAVASGREHFGVPGMSALLKPLADGIEVLRGVRVTGLRRDAAGWILGTDQEDQAELGPFDWVLVTAPAPQAAALVAGHGHLAARIGTAEIAPRWTLMMVPDGDLGLDRDKLIFDDEILDFAIRNDSKPGRVGPECWVVHARQDWSAANLEIEQDRARDRLVAAFRNQLPQGYPRHATAHRWRFAEVAKPVGEAHLIDPELGLGAAGDWCLGPLVTDALASGRALADRVLALVETPVE